MERMVKSGIAMLNVLRDWGVNHIYGIPGGSFNSIMHALYDKRDMFQYIQVRHEETGAIAASAEAKLTGKIGVCFGTAGPGATHLFNGLYDAKMDKVPMLALVGQSSSRVMNYDYFQEMNENPMFADVSVYNRTVMTPESLPYIVDDAIRKAYELKGVAVVTIPVDFGYVDIPDTFTSSASNRRTGIILASEDDVRDAVRLIQLAQRPVLYVGQGVRGAKDEVLALSEHYSMPIVISVLAKGILPDKEENLMGSSFRISTKPANEAIAMSDLIVFVGSDFPFAKVVFPEDAKFIQVDIDSSKLGKRHKTDVAILGDAKETMKRLVEYGNQRPDNGWLAACRRNKVNWDVWLRSFAARKDVPVLAEPVFRHINRIATEDAVFVADVGNVTLQAVRLLDMNGCGHKFTTSGLFATMGYGVPGGIGAKLSLPDRQVITLSGDGGFSMVMQDIITQVKYRLPIINVVFSNDSFGFIEGEQEDTAQPKYGVGILGADYAAIGRAMGAKGFTVDGTEHLTDIFDEAARSNVPVVIDVKMSNKRPFPAEAMVLDRDKYKAEDIAAFIEKYEVVDMPTLAELLKS